MKKEFVSREQVNLLPERLRRVEETDATKEFDFYLDNLYDKTYPEDLNIMVVGAGGSYPVALFAKHIIGEEYDTPNVEAVTPQTAVRKITQFDFFANCSWQAHYDVVIGISYSGKTADIKYVSEVCKKKGYPFLLLTGAKKESLTDLYQENENLKIISYFNEKDVTGKERGMVSMISTLAPVIIMDDDYNFKYFDKNQELLKNSEEFVSKLNIAEIAKAIKNNPVIHVFYEWNTLPTAIDIESKFVESGIANVILHEKKNFSHSRYTSLYNQKFSLVINLTKCDVGLSSDRVEEKKGFYKYEYDNILAEFLKKVCKEASAQYIEIGTEVLLTSEWNIYAMAILPYLITAIGEELEIDISKPLNPFPEEVSRLYDYKDKF